MKLSYKRGEIMWTLIFCLLAALNGYFAVINWPGPWSVLSAAFCLWMILTAARAVRST